MTESLHYKDVSAVFSSQGRRLGHIFQHGGEVIQRFRERGVGINKIFLVFKRGLELLVEVLLAGLRLFQSLAEPLVLLSE